ncbi:MAG: DUF2382 domain-containing protein [Pseudomonadota bacterium]|nr:DUF2382 domain-containing protein [Pseudomonadota bacterium]
MSRIVTALFASRDEAETARMRLASVVKVESARVIGRDTAGALVGLPIRTKQLDYLQEGLKLGDHVVLATVARGANPERIVEALSVTAADVPQREEPQLSYSIDGADDDKPAPTPVAVAERETAAPPPLQAREAEMASIPTREMPVQAVVAPTEQLPTAKHDRSGLQPSAAAESSEEVRIGESRLVRSRGTPVPEGDERSAFESQTPARRLSEEEVHAGGLLKDRVIEVVEMREEPIITREVVVREEVLIRKSVNQRSETVHDTVRRTEVEIEDLPSPK